LEIRLLKLYPPNVWEILKATSVSIPVSQTGHCEAISHRWSTADELPILLDGRKFLVSGALHQMLRTLQTPGHERLLWIDSICINQSDNIEKGWQIGMMKDIYRRADRVVGWLGYDRLTSGALTTLDEIRFMASDEDGVLDNLGSDYCAQSFVHSNIHATLRALGFLLCNDFFSRTWIVQEVALARKMILKHGTKGLVWKDQFIPAVEVFDTHSPMFIPPMYISTAMAQYLGKSLENIVAMEYFRDLLEESPT
jgi:hypothetical protein